MDLHDASVAFLSWKVTQLASYFEPLILAAVGVASKILDHQQQMTVLDQTKTLAESALQMLYAAKEGGGNPKVQFGIPGTHLGQLRSHQVFFNIESLQGKFLQFLVDSMCLPTQRWARIFDWPSRGPLRGTSRNIHN